MRSIDPTTGETIREYPELTTAEALAAAERAEAAQLRWRETSFDERSARLERVAALLRERAHGLAGLMADEMGKPLTQGRAEVEKCAWVCEYYAEHGARFLEPERIATDARTSYVRFDPLGVVLAIMPWNFPLWQVFRFGAPALMAGNGFLLKHAPNVPGCALAIEELLLAAGLPEGLAPTLLVAETAVGPLLEHEAVAAATLTGSPRAGRAVAAKAGAELKKTVLELGGSDPCVVLEDADLEAAVETCAQSRLINSGQSCIAAKRFVVVDAVREAFEARFAARLGAARVGPPREERTELGPLARVDLRDELHRQVTASLERGARLLVGGELPDGPGAFYPPTVLGDVRPGMPAFDEELFGPVAAIVPARDEDHALRLANGTRYGLGAAVFTRDAARGERIAAQRLEAGACFVNAFVKSDPRLPFGGIKRSGYGRELGALGIREFVNAKTVYVA